MANRKVDSLADMCNEVDDLGFRFKCAVGALGIIHGAMEDDGGANHQLFCDAMFSVYLQMCDMHKEIELLAMGLAKEYK